MYGYKSIFASRTVWGGVVAVVAGGAGLLGYALSPEDTKTLTNLLTEGAAVVGGLVAIWGRVKAKKEIG